MSRTRMGSVRCHPDPRRSGARFNSRSRMGSDTHAKRVVQAFRVSIHAPAWGATELPKLNRDFIVVSIHAPAWGATPLDAPSANWFTFQFTLPHGERHAKRTISPRLVLFQFTLPHGERLSTTLETLLVVSFNSRSRMGSDRPTRPSDPSCRVSIHAPAWGATSQRPRDRGHTAFQFTLPHGERPVVDDAPESEVQVSIHAPAWGATSAPSPKSLPKSVSIHAPAWGATRRCQLSDGQLLVSIHAPAWGATALCGRRR